MSISELKKRFLEEVDRVDRYLRREDTPIAEAVNEICPLVGPEYINSKYKRAFDLSIGVPSSVIATPLIATLAVAKVIEDGHDPFFVHTRASSLEDGVSDDLPVWKIRCMVPNSDGGSKFNSKVSHGLAPEDDPRNTPLGSFMRRHQLEELPQLYQVVLGRMSLLGLRAIPNDSAGILKEKWSEQRYLRWIQAYNFGKKGISGLSQTIGSPLKGGSDNYHLDLFYFKNASLGMDMYLVWRTATRLARIK